MKSTLRRFIVFNRLPIAVAMIALGLLLGFKDWGGGWYTAWIPFLVAIIMVAAHYLIGPMTLIQAYVENGDMEGAQKLLDRVKKPEWLYKPVRSSYYMLRANFSSMGENLDQAEEDLKRGLAAGMPEKEYEGTAYLQLGSISYKKGNTKEALENLRKAVKIGLPDEDSKATAFLQISSIYLSRRDFKSAKMYFSKAKSCKPTNEQVVSQLKEMSKYMARIPG
ncbi:MAG TPA: tetratricopeptide repeat protein [Flavipsychrobacter sp.]|jgi:tetratricopeptide (TPR) repeat protein